MKDDQSKQKPGKSATQPVSVGRKKTRTKRRWGGLLLLVLVLAALGLAATKMAKPISSAAQQGGTFAARRGDLIVTVTEGGSIRAHKSEEALKSPSSASSRGGRTLLRRMLTQAWSW